jgi:N-acetylglucosamine kinase-like BadF-type ATPase
MDESEIPNPKSQIFLGVDGGQSHTEAVVADEFGNVLGRGLGGPSNHAEIPGGRERLRTAIIDSVSAALKIPKSEIRNPKFAAAYFGMTGGADYKEEMIREIITAEIFRVGHDAPTALASGTGGKPGIVVISGTGSAIYGENERGEKARAGGLGYLFSDEGSGFWLAAQTIRLAIKEQDGVIADAGLEKLVLEHFRVAKIRDLTTPFYNGKVSRDEIAGFAKIAHEAAVAGNAPLREQIRFGADSLAENVKSVARRLRFTGNFPVVGVGGMFQGALMRECFVKSLAEMVPDAEFIAPRFKPAIGALLLAYRSAKIELSDELLSNLEKTQSSGQE